MSNDTKKVDTMQPEEAHELKQILKCNTDGIALPDTGSTFNLTNDEEPLANALKASQPMVSRTNVRQ